VKGGLKGRCNVLREVWVGWDVRTLSEAVEVDAMVGWGLLDGLYTFLVGGGEAIGGRETG